MKKRFGKFSALIISALMLSSTLAACGGSSSDGQASDGGSSSDSKGKTTITYSIWDKNQEPGMKAMIDAFESENPDIKVNLEVTPWDQYWTKLEAAANGGVLPDVFWMHSNNYNRYAGAGMLLDMTDRIKDSSLDMSKFPEGLVEMYQYDGKSYAIPKDFDTIALWYNKKLFDDDGVAYPNENWKWEDLLEASRKLTNQETGIYGVAAHLNSQEGFYNFVHQNGGEIIREDNGKKVSGFDMPETKEAIQWYVDLSLKEKVSPSNQQLQDTSPIAMFQSGKVAMVFLGSWMVTELKQYPYVLENCDVTVLPEGKERASVYNGLGYAVSAKTKNPDAAWKFVEFLGGQKANEIQAEKGSAIPAYEGTQDPWVEFSPEFNLGVYPEMISYGRVFAYSKTKPQWEEVQNEVLRKVFEGEITVDEGCDEIAKRMNEILAEEN